MNKINKNTKILAVIGNPIEHSKSPLIHNAAIEKLNLDFEYFAFKVENLENAVNAMKEFGIVGYSVTIPHKIEIMKYLDEIDPIAKKIGAVNTVHNKGGKLFGTNTDKDGAINPIKEKINISKKRAYVLGSGGAAKAIIVGLINEGAIVTIFGRDLKHAEEVAKEFGATAKELDKVDSEFDIIINATPVGMYPKIDVSPVKENIFKSGQIVMDAIYNPIETKFLKDAKKAGAEIIYGTEMFLGQAFTQFKIFTGKDPPKEIMRKVLLEEMRK